MKRIGGIHLKYWAIGAAFSFFGFLYVWYFLSVASQFSYLAPALALVICFYLISVVVTYSEVFLHVSVSGDLSWPWNSLYFLSLYKSFKANKFIELNRTVQKLYPNVLWRAGRMEGGKSRYVVNGIVVGLVVLIFALLVTIPLVQESGSRFTADNLNTAVNNTASQSPFFVNPGTLMQMHVAVVSITLLTLVFSYEYSSGKSTSYPRYLYFNEFLLIVIGCSFSLSLLAYVLPIYSNFSAPAEAVVVLWLIVLFAITVAAVGFLVIRVISFATQDDIDIYDREAGYTLGKLTAVSSRLTAAEGILSIRSTALSAKTTRACKPTVRLTAGDLELKPGNYVTDVNMKKLTQALTRQDFPINGQFRLNLARQITSTDETMFYIVNTNTDDILINEFALELGEAVKTQVYEPFFELNSFSTEYNIVYDYIENITTDAMRAVDRKNVSRFDQLIYAFHSLFHDMNMSSNIKSKELEQMRAVAVNGLLDIFKHLLDSDQLPDRTHKNGQESIHSIQARSLVTQTYLMSIDLMNGDLKKVQWISASEEGETPLLFRDLLCDYETEAEGQHQELEEHIRSRLRELSENDF